MLARLGGATYEQVARRLLPLWPGRGVPGVRALQGVAFVIMLVAALVLFGVLHITPAVPALRDRGRAAFGTSWGAVYGVASLVLFVLVLWAFRQAPVVPLYEPPTWGRHANYALTLVAFIFVGIFLFRGSWRNRIRHPMAIGVSLWALGHLLANGDVRTTVLFAGLAGAAVVHALLRGRAGAITPSPERGGHNLMSVLAGVALYGLATQLHTVIAGVPIMQLN